MKIKYKTNTKLNFLNNILSKNFFYKSYFFLTVFCFIFFCFIFFQTGIWENKKKEFFERAHLNGIINYIYFPEIFYYKINSIFEKQNKISIDMNQKNVIKIENNRKNILDFLGDEQKEFKHIVPFDEASSFIIYKNKRLKSDIRLKGDRRIHFEDKLNSSYRLDIKKEEVFDGMSKFSIQKPRIRNYLNEWIFHELLGEGGLVKLNYDFYNFYLNGNFLGYYSIEESFGKALLERNKRRNGPIFSLFEMFTEISDKKKFEVYNKKYWEKEENISITKSAIQKLNNFLVGKTKLEEVFDLEKWAWFFAVTDLTYTYHGVAFKSVKFYYNPINGKFEPIGFDGHKLVPNYSKYITKKKPELTSTNFSIAKNKITNKAKNYKKFSYTIERDFFFQNEKINYNFYDKYVKSINKITSKKFLDNFFKIRKKKIKKINSGIYSDNYIFDYNSMRKSGIGIYYFNKKEIYRRAQSLSEEFSVNSTALFIEENPYKLIFSNHNYNNFFLTDGKILCNDYDIDIHELKIDKKIFYLKKNDKFNFSCKRITFKDSITGKVIKFDINKYNSFDNRPIKTKYNFLEYFYLTDKKLKLKNNSMIIDQNVFIPKGYEVLINGGQEIILENNAFIFSNSNWVVGDLSQKTLIHGTRINHGGGIIIYDNEKKSFFINCKFEYLNGLKPNILSDANNFFEDRLIYGSINFFQTSITIKNSIFKNIYSEDALNIISSKYLIKDTFFENTKHDAIDIDFSNGKIFTSYFDNIGDDAIDFSGSNSEISFLNFKKIGDKSISVGENSFLNIYNIKGENSLVGIASKDGSKTYAKNIEFINVDYPFAAYQKKKAYKHGKLVLNNFFVNNYKHKYIRDFNSTIFDDKSKKKLGKSNKEIDKIIESII